MKIKIVMLTALFLISGYSFANKNSEGSTPMIDLDNTKDWCAGRYTFKLPINSKLNNGADRYNSFTIKSKEGATISDLNNAYATIRGDYTNSVSKIILDNPEKRVGNKITRLFVGKTGTFDGVPNHLYAFILDRNILFTFEIPFMPEKQALVYSEMDKILQSIQARDNNTIPDERGVCITNGFIKDSDTTFRKGTNTLAFTLNGLPSVRYSFQVDSFAQPIPNLIDRTQANLKEKGIFALTATKFKTIRSGVKNQVGGSNLTGLEWVSTAPMKGRNGIIASWEHGGTAGNALDPAILFNFDSGNEGNNVQTSSMSENEALKTYETILNTIRKF